MNKKQQLTPQRSSPRIPAGLEPIHDFFVSILPDRESRLACLNIFADAIDEAHGLGESCWVITRPKGGKDRVHLNVGIHQVFAMYEGRIRVRQVLDSVTDEVKTELADRVKWGPGGNKAIPTSGWASMAPQDLVGVWPQLHPIFSEHLEKAYELRETTPFKAHHDPQVLDYLRWVLQRKLPSPGYSNDEYVASKRFFKIAPGHDAKYWDECRDNDYVCVGWDETGDLREFESREAFDARFRELFAEHYNNHQAIIQQKADEVWTLRGLEPGDLVIANRGKTRVLAVGEVKPPGYEWSPGREAYRHTVHVTWDTSYEQEIPTQERWGFHTVLRLSQETYLHILNQDWPPDDVSVVHALNQWLSANGFYFTAWQIATFFTALQTKGFVVLSGISGTGKSKLAQHFARAFPHPRFSRPAEYEEVISITVQPYMLKYNRFVIPKHTLPLYDAPPAGETREISVRYGGEENDCRLTHETSGTDYIVLYFRGNATEWFKSTFAEGDTMIVEPLWDKDTEFLGFHLQTEETYQMHNQTVIEEGQNWHFTTVRPDWRDSKSLLGYYNPLTGTYEWTPFLRFLLRVVRSYRRGEQLAWFVILDEMNLAHVEYYFADLLSILESGRDEAGWTQEPLQLLYPDEAEGDLPPRELSLPPNLYVVGTVNVDETTHTFSPKVQDRAFTLELTEADFSHYPLSVSEPAVSNPGRGTEQAILDVFSAGGRFARIEKETVAAYVAEHSEIKSYLQTLNRRLRPYGFHFGYRVFDEIVAFLDHADRTGIYDDVLTQNEDAMYEGLDATDVAFDAAVLMKVLPKFHGSRGQLEIPLREMLAWCVDPGDPDDATTETKVADLEGLKHLPYRLPHTAERLRRMLWMLQATGFAV